MRKERMKEIAFNPLVNIIEYDFHNGIESYGCYSIEEYCMTVLNASRYEIEYILEMNIENIKAVEDYAIKLNK